MRYWTAVEGANSFYWAHKLSCCFQGFSGVLEDSVPDDKLCHCADLLLLCRQEGSRKSLSQQVLQLLEGSSLFAVSRAVPPQHSRQLWMQPAHLSCRKLYVVGKVKGERAKGIYHLAWYLLALDLSGCTVGQLEIKPPSL